jgi:phage terminase large subunit-like protein
MNISLDYTPRLWQRQCHINKKRFSVYALHRRSGKTELAIMELIDKAIKTDKELGMFVYVAPFLRQAKAIAWARLKQKIEPLRRQSVVEINEGELSVRFKHNGAIIRLFGGDNPDALRGMRLDGCVIDEVAQIKNELWSDIVQPALSDRLGWSLFIGTPQGINLFSELYYKAVNEEGWTASRYTVFDTDSLHPDEVTRLKRDMSETSFAREYLCDFSAQGDDQLIALADTEDASKRVYQQDHVNMSPVVLGIDPARFGDDRSVVFRRQGRQAFKPVVYRGIDNMDLASRVANLIEEHDPDAVFCDAGAGSGVIDRLRQLSYDVIEIPFGGKATKPEQYLNRRSEMWWLMKQWIEEGGAIPNDIALKQELATPIYWYDNVGRRVLESKDQIKKRLQGAGSPDLADALALTFALPVAKKEMEDIYIKKRKEATHKKDYDPYTRI